MADIQKIKVNGTEYDINLGSDKDVAVSSVKAGSITGESSLYVGTTIRPSSGTITNLKVADNKVTLEGVGAENTALVDITVEKNGEMSVAGSVVADKLIASNSISLAGSVITEWPSGGNSFTFISENVNTVTGTGRVNIVGSNGVTLSEVNINDVITVDTEKSVFTLGTQTTRVSGTWVDTPAIKLNGVLRTSWPTVSGDISVNNLTATGEITASNIRCVGNGINTYINPNGITTPTISVTGTDGITTTKITANSMSADRLFIGNNTILLESTGGGGIVTPNIITPSITLNGVTRTSWPEVNGDITVNNLSANTVTLGGVTKSSWPSGDGGGSVYMRDDIDAGSVVFAAGTAPYDYFEGVFISGSLDVYPERGDTYEHIKIRPFFDLNYQKKVGLEFMDNASTISYITGSNIVCTVNSGQNSGFGIVGSITINGKYNSTNYPVTIKSDNNVYINGNITIDGTRNNISYPVTITSNNGIFINGKMQNSNNNNKCPSIAYVSTYTSGIATLADMIRNIEYRLATANI